MFMICYPVFNPALEKKIIITMIKNNITIGSPEDPIDYVLSLVHVPLQP